jgi:hypothetical protein
LGGVGDDALRGGSDNDALNGGADTDDCRGDDGTADTAVNCEAVTGVSLTATSSLARAI